MQKRKKSWLILAILMALCAVNAPVHAEEASPVEVAAITEAPEQIIEAPIEQTTAEAVETPTEQPAAEVIEAPTESTVTPVAEPTLLIDRLAPETYAELEDPNARIVLIDISEQYVWAFENGSAVLESPMISGKANTKAETSRGAFQIELKKPGKYLRGPRDKNGNYAWERWVDYWMLFDKDRSIGLHDASWRGIEQYVPETYTTNGSRGCINLPCDFAPLLYDFVEIGTPVIVQD